MYRLQVLRHERIERNNHGNALNFLFSTHSISMSNKRATSPSLYSGRFDLIFTINYFIVKVMSETYSSLKRLATERLIQIDAEKKKAEQEKQIAQAVRDFLLNKLLGQGRALRELPGRVARYLQERRQQRERPPQVGAAARGLATPAGVPTRPRLVGFALIVLMAAVPLFIAYGLRSPGANVVAHKFEWAIAFLLREQGISHDAGVVLQHLWLPTWVKGFFEGIIAIKAHNDSGHLSFLLGQQRSTGWWYFYLVALAAKTPIPLLVTGPIGMVVLAREGWQAGDGWRMAPLLSFLAVLIFASGFSHINIGIRHVLVLYPFMALGAAHSIALGWRALHKPALGPLAVVGSGGLAVLVAWQALPLWTANPDYLPYFNEAVAHPEQVLVDSDLDWGQDLWRLEQRAAAMKIPKLNLAYRGTADLAREKLPPFVIMPPWKPATGWVAISALAKVHDPKGYAWLDAYKPIESVGKTIELYYVAPPRP